MPTTGQRRGWSLCSARALFAAPPPQALGRQPPRDRCACHRRRRLPYVSPSGPFARSLVRPPTHARASQARQTRSPPARSSRRERIGGRRCVGSAWCVLRLSARQAPPPAALAVTLRVSSALEDVAVASRLSGDAGSAAARFGVCVAFSWWPVRGSCGSRVNGGGRRW